MRANCRRILPFLAMILAGCGRESGAPVVPPAEVAADPLGAAKAAMEETDYVRSAGQWAAWLGSLDAGSVAAARTAMAELAGGANLPDSRKAEIMAAIDRRWAELEPDGFLAACARREAEYSDSAQQSALRELMGRDADAALRRYLDLPLRDHAVAGAMFLFEVAGKRDPEKLVLFFRDKPEWSDPMAILPTNLYLGWAGKDGIASWRALQAEPDVELRRRVSANLARQALRRQKDLVEDWLAAMDNPEDRDVLLEELNDGALSRRFATPAPAIEPPPPVPVAIAPSPPKRPPPTEAEIDAAYFDGPSSFLMLADIHEASDSKWQEEVFRRHPRRGIERTARMENPDYRIMAAWTLARIWPEEDLGKEALRLLAEPDTGHRVIGAAMADRWVRAQPAAALPALAVLPAGPARIVFAKKNLVETAINAMPDERKLVALLESIKDPVARDSALREWTKHRGTWEGPRKALQYILAMPRSTGRDAAMQTWCRRFTAGSELSPESLLRMLLEIDPGRHAEVRDAMLEMAARQMAGRERENIGLAIDAALAIGVPARRVRLLADQDGFPMIASLSPRVIEVLAREPAGRVRDHAMWSHALELVRLGEESGLAAARATASPLVRAAIVREFLGRELSPDWQAKVLEVARDIPQEWIGPGLAALITKNQATIDPAGWWRAHAADARVHNKHADLAADVMRAWATRAPEDALQAWSESDSAPSADAEFVSRIILPAARAGAFHPILNHPRADGIADTLIVWWNEPSVATRFCLRFGDPRRRTDLLGRAFSQWVQKDAPAAMAWARRLPDDQMGELLAKTMAGRIERSADAPVVLIDWLLDLGAGAAWQPDGIATGHEIGNPSVLRAIDEANRALDEIRVTMASVRKHAPDGAEASFARMPAGPEKSAAWLGLLDAACASGDFGAIRTVAGEYGAAAGERFQSHAALKLVDAFGAGAKPPAIATAIAAVPWPVARQRVAGYHVRLALGRGDKELAIGIARAFPDACHRHALLDPLVTRGTGTDEPARPTTESAGTLEQLRAGRAAILHELAKLEPPVPVAPASSGKEDR